jgi:hypothetical protein
VGASLRRRASVLVLLGVLVGAASAESAAGAPPASRDVAAIPAIADFLGSFTPPNDDFEDEESLGGSPRWFVIRDNFLATAQPGEPLHAGQVGPSSVWFSWDALASGPVRLDTVDSEFDSLLAVYTGPSLESLVSVASDDDSGGGGTSKLAFQAEAGTRYHFAVAGKGDATGRFVLALSPQTPPPPANDDFVAAQVLSGPNGSVDGTNVSATREHGEPYHFPERWGGASVWYRWTAPANGTVVFRRDEEDLAGFFMAAYTGPSVDSLTQIEWEGRVTPWDITFRVTGGTTYAIAIDGVDRGLQGTEMRPFTLSWTFHEPPANDHFAAATTLEGRAGELSATNAGATRESGEPEHSNDPGGASVWYRWTASESERVRFDLWREGLSAALAVYRGTSISDLVPIGTRSSGGLSPALSIALDAVPGTTYFVAVDGRFGTIGTFTLRWKPDSPPNDYLYQAHVLEGVQAEHSVDNLWASKEPGEPNHAGSAGGASLWYRYTPPATGRLTITTEGTEIPIALAVYSGSFMHELTELAADVSSDGSAQVSLVAGATVRIAVDALAEPGGSVPRGAIELGLRFRPVNDDFADATLMEGPNGVAIGTLVGGTAEAGEPPHAQHPPSSSIWYRWTAPDTPTRSLEAAVFGTAAGSRAAVYTGPSLGSLEGVVSDDSLNEEGALELSFRTIPGKEYFFAIDGAHAQVGTAISLHLQTPLDETAPVVALTGPMDGAAVGGQPKLTAEASDDYGVVQVEFLVDHEVVGSDTDEPYSVTWDPLGKPDGPVVIHARATNTSGLQTVSAPRTVILDRTAPVIVRAPSARLVSNSQLSTTGVPVVLSWSGTDATTRIVRYDLMLNKSGPASSVPTAQATRVLTPGRTYWPRVRGWDPAGNGSGWFAGADFTLTARQETAPTIAYSRGWRRQFVSSAFGGAVKYTSTRSAYARLTFTGSQVGLVATKGPGRGRTAVYIDARYVRTIDLYAPTLQRRRMVFTHAWRNSGSHRVTVKALGKKHPRSTGRLVDLDAFVVLS